LHVYSLLVTRHTVLSCFWAHVLPRFLNKCMQMLMPSPAGVFHARGRGRGGGEVGNKPSGWHAKMPNPQFTKWFVVLWFLHKKLSLFSSSCWGSKHFKSIKNVPNMRIYFIDKVLKPQTYSRLKRNIMEVWKYYLRLEIEKKIRWEQAAASNWNILQVFYINLCFDKKNWT